MASGRQRVEDDEDDVYDDGRFYDYRPRKISLDEIMSGSEKVNSLNTSLNEEAMYLDQKVQQLPYLSLSSAHPVVFMLI